MTPQIVELNDRQLAFIRRVVDAGEFRDAAEVMQRAIDVLEQDAEEERQKLAALRAAIAEGVAELDRGEGIVIPPGGISRFTREVFDEVVREAQR